MIKRIHQSHATVNFSNAEAAQRREQLGLSIMTPVCGIFCSICRHRTPLLAAEFGRSSKEMPKILGFDTGHFEKKTLFLSGGGHSSYVPPEMREKIKTPCRLFLPEFPRAIGSMQRPRALRRRSECF